jgi:hypothetical protein
LGAALQADGEYEVRVYGLKHQKEKRSMDHFAGLDVSLARANIAAQLVASERQFLNLFSNRCRGHVQSTS